MNGTLAQKERERRYLIAARECSSLIPGGEPREHERPDFLLAAKQGTLGIELTELCTEHDRQRAGAVAMVGPRARKDFEKRPDAVPVRVTVVLTHDGEEMASKGGVNALSLALADFVYARRHIKGSYEWDAPATRDSFPEGFSLIGIFEPATWEPDPTKWNCVEGWESGLAPRALIEGRIADKNARVAEYRRACDEVWLLIVNDQWIGPGEVHVRAEDVATCAFDFVFDKVLLYIRPLNEARSEVIELRRL